MASYYEVEGVRVYYAGGEGSPLPSSTGTPVNIDEIRQRYNKDNLFEDPDFLADFSSIGNISGDSAQGLSDLAKKAQNWKWLRVPQLAQGLKAKKVAFAYDASGNGNPFSETDAIQGELGDCYYVAALADLTLKPDKLRFVVPADNDNGFEPENYCGAFHFRLYDPAFDKWVDVVVDDRLPASSVLKLAGQIKSATPAFTKLTEVLRGAEAAEAWPALAEKAYAKYYGSYANVEGGFSSQAMVNFTAGFGEIIKFRRDDDHKHIEGVKFTSTLERVKTLLQTYLGAKGFVGFGTFDEGVMPADAAQGYGKNNLGLRNKHAYSVLGVQEVEEDNGEKHYIVKVRNPHGQGEWKGPFSDNDPIWDRIVNAPPRVSKDEGIFYIKIEDVIKYFEAAQFSLPHSKDGDHFSLTLGKWQANLQLKSLTHDHRTLKYFPAYKFEVTQGDLSAAVKEGLGKRTFIALSMVLHGYKSQFAGHVSFGYYLYKIPDESVLANPDQIYSYKQSEAFVNNLARDASGWAFLDSAGTYLLATWINTTDMPEELRGKDIGFSIRLYTPNQTELQLIPAQEF